MVDKEKVRVRFAPSPTGIPHVGSIRTVLFNYFFAKKNNGTFILRIEDTDQARQVEGAVEAIKKSLEWLGILWDEYYVQSERVAEYKKYTDELVSKGLAYEDNGAIRFKVPDEGETSWVDLIGNKKVEFKNSEIEDFVILKSDGFPTYHLANVVDDHLMEITHVIRGDDWIPSAPKHLLLYKAFSWDAPIFAHLPNVLGSDGKKLSKRRGAKSVLDYKKDGYLASAILNYLMLLGFSPKDDREILSKEDFENEFELKKVNVAPATFDEKKLLWMDGVYIREKVSNEEFKKLLEEFYEENVDVKKYISNSSVLALAKSRIGTLSDFAPLVTRAKFEMSQDEKEIAKELNEKLSELPESEWNKDAIFDIFKKIMEQHTIRMPILYKIYTGQTSGLPLPDFLESIGKESTLSLIKQ